MDRRELLLGAGAVALSAVTAAAFGAEHAHDHMHHGSAKNQGLIDATADCIKKGQACHNHCLDLLAQGDKEMAACARTVSQMLATCAALEQLSSLNSRHAAKMAKVAAEVCKECEDECRKHEKKHAECKACADSCAQCLKECNKAV